MRNLTVLLIFTCLLNLQLFSQGADSNKPSLSETQTWLKEKIQSNGVGKYRATKYNVEFTDSCVLTINELGFSGEVLNKFAIQLKTIDFEKVTKRITKNGTLIITISGIELHFVPNNNEEFYNRLVKALRNGKQVCGGVADDKF